MGERIRGSRRYVSSVVQYLTSPLGGGVSDGIARQLIALDPLAIGMPEEPSPACLHATRAFLEASAREALCGDESTGVYFVSSLRAAASA